MSDDMGMAEEAMNDAIVESAGYDDEQATAPNDVAAYIAAFRDDCKHLAVVLGAALEASP